MAAAATRATCARYRRATATARAGRTRRAFANRCARLAALVCRARAYESCCRSSTPGWTAGSSATALGRWWAACASATRAAAAWTAAWCVLAACTALAPPLQRTTTTPPRIRPMLWPTARRVTLAGACSCASRSPECSADATCRSGSNCSLPCPCYRGSGPAGTSGTCVVSPDQTSVRALLASFPGSVLTRLKQVICRCAAGWTGTDCSVQCPTCLAAANGGGGTCVFNAARCQPAATDRARSQLLAADRPGGRADLRVDAAGVAGHRRERASRASARACKQS